MQQRRTVQNGWVEKTGKRTKMWTGHWYVYVMVDGVRKRRPRSRVLGRCDDLTEAQARAALSLIANQNASHSHIVSLAVSTSLGLQLIQKASGANSRTNIGSVGELLVAADLMSRGFAVYRALSPFAPCDLIAVIAGEMCRVEVKVADRREDGTYKRRLDLRDGAYDLLAVLSRDGCAIHYEGKFLAPVAAFATRALGTPIDSERSPNVIYSAAIADRDIIRGPVITKEICR